MQSRPIRFTTEHTVPLCGREVVCRLTRSRMAKKLRLKVTLGGLEIVVPQGRQPEEGLAFLQENEHWAAMELERSSTRQAIRKPVNRTNGQILFHGESVPVRVMLTETWQGPNRVSLESGEVTILCGPRNRTPIVRSLENWLRKQARVQITGFLAPITKRLKRKPNRVYVMGQRTKWGNCSALGNLSFNWRLIMAPDYVLRYLVVHEAVHLAIPDHSKKYWLTVQSLCRETEEARRWLVANERRLSGPLLIDK
jgi:predicted metal-dependent hydrolase